MSAGSLRLFFFLTGCDVCLFREECGIIYHKAIFPAAPKSSVAVAMPKALKTRLIVGSEIVLAPFSIFGICALCTPIRKPSSVCVMCWAMRVLRIVSPTRSAWTSALSWASIDSRSGVPLSPQSLSRMSSAGMSFICGMVYCPPKISPPLSIQLVSFCLSYLASFVQL